MENLSFQSGNAEELPLISDSCDILLNVESSHRYLQIERFLAEVNRILRDGGHFLFTDFRYDYEWPDMDDLFEKYRLKIKRKKDTTASVIRALEMNDSRNRELIHRLVPGYLQKVMLNFAGAIDSETYNFFISRKYVYRSYIFQKY
jgi:ubiquinone/menaquinone biosynthesis C-methylase UbiE